MNRVAFLNGSFVSLDQANVSILDRGFLFGDGVYEVSAVLDGRLIDNANHLARLARSLDAIGIGDPYRPPQWAAYQEELVARNALVEGIVYIQVTRGVAERDFHFPAMATPTVAMFTQPKQIVEAPLARTGAAVITVPDLRWARRDIKSVALLAQVLAKQQAVAAGAAEAFMVEDGFVTEGASSSAFMITPHAELVTRPLSNAILPGITREALIGLAHEQDLRLIERPFTVAECQSASEVFYSSASTIVVPVVSIDGQPIVSGRPGPATARLRARYLEIARS